MIKYSFKPFNEMTEKDYTIVGFKSGLEIHQQLMTSKKLFCRCPAGKYSDIFNAEILRHMRPTLSELGEYDGTALMEFKTHKEIIYQINRDTVCTYEMDDTPPFEMNEEALDIALNIALLLNCTMVDEIHIARKQYLDGSIPTGFQRTTIVGVDGKIPYRDGEINIIQLGLEEDACREVSDQGHRRVYLTDRLGMPLIETVTAPEMRNPFEVAEVANILRRLVRSTGKVRMGMGAAREDVNVSVDGGTRIEIKGVPRIQNIPLLTYNEAMRQWNLLRLREELHKRGITKDTFDSKIENITKILHKTYFLPIKNAITGGNIVNCVVLRGFRGLLKWQTQTDTYFSREISDRIRVIACLTDLPNLFHSDSPSETLASSEWRTIKKTAGATDDDAIVIVWGNSRDVETASNEIIIRAKEATIGIPSETRQALRDGTNGFERILPGPDRMYPDTDLPPKKITVERLDKIRVNLPEHFWDREKWYHDLNIPTDVIKPLSISRYAELFRKLINEWNINPVLASIALIQYPKKIKRKGINIDTLTPEIMENIFNAYKNGLTVKDGIYYLLEQTLKEGFFSTNNIPLLCSESELTKVINDSFQEIQNINFYDDGNKPVIMMELVMKRLRGRIDGEVVMKHVNSLIEKQSEI